MKKLLIGLLIGLVVGGGGVFGALKFAQVEPVNGAEKEEVKTDGITQKKELEEQVSPKATVVPGPVTKAAEFDSTCNQLIGFRGVWGYDKGPWFFDFLKAFDKSDLQWFGVEKACYFGDAKKLIFMYQGSITPETISGDVFRDTGLYAYDISTGALAKVDFDNNEGYWINSDFGKKTGSKVQFELHPSFMGCEEGPCGFPYKLFTYDAITNSVELVDEGSR